MPVPPKLSESAHHRAVAPSIDKPSEQDQPAGKHLVRSNDARFANVQQLLFWLPAPGLFFDHVLERAVL